MVLPRPLGFCRYLSSTCMHDRPPGRDAPRIPHHSYAAQTPTRKHASTPLSKLCTTSQASFTLGPLCSMSTNCAPRGLVVRGALTSRVEPVSPIYHEDLRTQEYCRIGARHPAPCPTSHVAGSWTEQKSSDPSSRSASRGSRLLEPDTPCIASRCRIRAPFRPPVPFLEPCWAAVRQVRPHHSAGGRSTLAGGRVRSRAVPCVHVHKDVHCWNRHIPSISQIVADC